MITKEDAIKTACEYTANRLGIFGISSMAEIDQTSGNWDVSITGEQEEDLLKVIVKLTVRVYQDGNGNVKTRLTMPPIKTEDIEGELIVQDINWSDDSVSENQAESDETNQNNSSESPVTPPPFQPANSDWTQRSGFADLPA